MNASEIEENRVGLLVATDHPLAGTSTGGGCLCIVDPYSGSTHSSCKLSGELQSSQVGVSSISLFQNFAMVYGSGKNDKDSYGMFLTIRSNFQAPIMHWKCRLVEAQMKGGLLVSPVTNTHVIGGGASGGLFVWDALSGFLVKSLPNVHYQAINCMTWSDENPSRPWDCHLITGGADGMVHVFSHLDLVEANNTTTSISPIRSWTSHHLPVTALVPLVGGRIVSTSEDGQVIIMELSSGDVIVTIPLGVAIHSLCTNSLSNKLYCGSVKGTIHVINLDDYALQKSVQLGAAIVHRNRSTRQMDSFGDRVLGNSPESKYLSELRGHNRKIASLNTFEDNDTEYVVSGDDGGEIRVWENGCCVKIIHPWLHPETKHSGKQPPNCRVSSIRILRDQKDPQQDSLFASKQKKNVMASLFSPLQKYPSDSNEAVIAVPFLKPQPRSVPLSFGHVHNDTVESIPETRKRKASAAEIVEQPPPDTSGDDPRDEIARLKRELETAQATIQRWEEVNNKLVKKLQG